MIRYLIVVGKVTRQLTRDNGFIEEMRLIERADAWVGFCGMFYALRLKKELRLPA